MKIQRKFTTAGQNPFDTVEWTTRSSRISNPDGSVVFEMPDAEVPKTWSQLATDKRITSRQIAEIVREEVGVEVKLAEPTLHRTVTMPVLTKGLRALGEERIARALEKLGSIFGGYAEWGQPVHEVGNDVRLLGLPIDRPDTVRAFRMLCRHNRYVQEFGAVRDPLEISRRERVWRAFLDRIEEETGRPASLLGPREFRELVERWLDLERFELRQEPLADSPTSPPGGEDGAAGAAGNGGAADS